jgi:hypothetical protein
MLEWGGIKISQDLCYRPRRHRLEPVPKLRVQLQMAFQRSARIECNGSALVGDQLHNPMAPYGVHWDTGYNRACKSKAAQTALNPVATDGIASCSALPLMGCLAPTLRLERGIEFSLMYM